MTCNKVLERTPRGHEGGQPRVRSWNSSSGDTSIAGDTTAAASSDIPAKISPEPSSEDPDSRQGLQSLPSVPGVSAATPGGAGVEDQAQVRELGARQRRQLSGSMKQAERQWSEMMSFLCGPEPDALIESFKKKAARELQAPSRKQKQMYQEILQCSTDQLRTVSEVFNPNRFGGRVRKHRLKAGRVFDLALESDLLKRSAQQSVLSY